MMNLKSQISRFRKSKNGKTLAENFAYLSLLQLAGYLFPLITMPYIARIIGPFGYGKIAFAAAIMVWIQCVVDWGFSFTATRDVVRCREDIQKVSAIFSNVLWARVFLMIVSLFVLTILVFIIPKFRENAAIILITFLMVPGHLLFPSWFFQAMEKMKYITILNVLSKLLFTIAVFVFIKDANDYILQPLLNSFGFIVAGLIGMYFVIGKWGVRISKPNWSRIFTTIWGGKDVFINDLMPNLYNAFSVLLLGFCAPPQVNGIYDAGKKFTSLGYQLLGVVSKVFFPYLARNGNKHNLYAKLLLSISSLLVIGFIIFAPLIIRIFCGPEFADSVLILRITAIALLFISLTNIYGKNYLILHNKDKVLRNRTIVASLIGFCIAIPFVYYWGAIGAALTYLLSNIILGSSIAITALRMKKNENNKRENENCNCKKQ